MAKDNYFDDLPVKTSVRRLSADMANAAQAVRDVARHTGLPVERAAATLGKRVVGKVRVYEPVA